MQLGPDQLVLTGGRYGSSLDSIYDVDLVTYDFLLRPETLRVPRDLFAAVEVPDDYIDCDALSERSGL